MLDLKGWSMEQRKLLDPQILHTENRLIKRHSLYYKKDKNPGAHHRPVE